MQIPQIIHQIWSGIDEPLPKYFELLGDTWKEHHPTWKYIFWDNQKMNKFVQKHYPQLWDTYNSFQYNIQRWDAVRYLILNKFGGMYVDFDYECLETHNILFEGQKCCFASEPVEGGSELEGEKYLFNNALMASIPNHPFIKAIIEFIFSYKRSERIKYNYQKGFEVLVTTGPIALNRLYQEYRKKNSIYLIPSKYVTPITSNESRQILLGNMSDEDVENKLQDAFSIHYYFSEWMITES
ncbi:glycosyltransferase [Dysgonomonas sp. 37-18]|uniref:glycosyltransferase family 32 protein n=1 Tax=Dysgonomonas sp. 37-18 TaxID=1895907 RepID=UPI000926C5A1|nr:glycosyltransferase [Dysgonomonas sp. 37-18]OJX62667.1 MAG: hypothetical protein BGO84_04010 [Dysgonomonas sp. 37-18]